jgi:hypothetical protein
MMKNSCKVVLIFLLETAMLTGGCNFPSTSQSKATPEAVYTQAAETIIAQLTELAAPEGAITQEASATRLVTGAATAQPTETETQTGTATLTATPAITQTVTPTQAAQDPKAGLGDPDWLDRFNDEANWSPYEDEYVSFQIADGKLVMQTKPGESRDSWLLTWPDPADYYLEATTQTESCSGLDRYGIIFRTNASEGYLYGFTCDGEYSLRKWDGEQFTALIDWTYSSYILSGEGQINRMGLIVEGSQYKMYANDYYLGQAEDNAYDEGGFGLFVGSKNGESFIVSVDEIAYWELP